MLYVLCKHPIYSRKYASPNTHKHTHWNTASVNLSFSVKLIHYSIFSQKLFALQCGSRNLASWQIIRNDVLGLGEYKSLSIPSILTPALPRATLASGLDQWCCWCTVSVWTWCPHLMELMWMDFTLYLCHLSCINSHPCLSISQSLQLRQRVCVCV